MRKTVFTFALGAMIAPALLAAQDATKAVAGGGEDAPGWQMRIDPRAGGATTHGGNRFLNFLRASWAELQRVQWPDRRQVAQATGVVIGFVIIAGLYLGAADWVAQKVVNFVL